MIYIEVSRSAVFWNEFFPIIQCWNIKRLPKEYFVWQINCIFASQLLPKFNCTDYHYIYKAYNRNLFQPGIFQKILKEGQTFQLFSNTSNWSLWYIKDLFWKGHHRLAGLEVPARVHLVHHVTLRIIKIARCKTTCNRLVFQPVNSGELF